LDIRTHCEEPAEVVPVVAEAEDEVEAAASESLLPQPVTAIPATPANAPPMAMARRLLTGLEVVGFLLVSVPVMT
jgi:hypothetical protein